MGKLFRFVISGKSVAELKENMKSALDELAEFAEGNTPQEVPQDFLTEAAARPGKSSNENPALDETVAAFPSQAPTPSHSASASATPSPSPTGVDSMGLPWDERIHSSNMAQNKDGSWRTKRGVEPSYVKQIEHELIAKIKAGGAAPAPTFHHSPAGFTPPAPAAPVLATPPAPGLQQVGANAGTGHLQHPAHPPIVQALPPNPPIAPVGNVYPPPAPSIAPVAAAVPPLAQPIAPSTVIPAAYPAAQLMTSSHSFETFAANFPLVLSHLVTEGKLTQEYIAALKNYFKLEQIYQANDQQKAEMFEAFCTAGIITKVGG